MPTKDELTSENALLKARVQELEANGNGETFTVPEVVDSEGEPIADGEVYIKSSEGLVRVKGEDGAVMLDENDEVVKITPLRVRDADGQFAEPEDGALYRYDGSGDMVKADGEVPADKLAMMQADLQRVEIERDQARNEAARLKGKIADMGTLHGSIDSLPGVAG